ncbi:MAG: CopG family transcriptional regulator [Desulfobulbus sp.]|jgi:hypothetical protein|uniref:plasmid mobilization protein n=1 Tax=Desulfobulbus sp. TaxID=895 RepID=UPI0028404078|nr:hypothetical protein [Desulfobulbus sp.]MDR2549077.1 CopG family transcriptional regulator [Desulfobulbus sp.]
MPSPNKKVLYSYLTPEEYEQVKISAQQARLSLSTFVKRVCLGQEVRSKADQQATLAVLKANADLGRLGGLFKKALSDGSAGTMATELRQTLRQIEKSQAVVTRTCRTVVELLKKGSRQ